jgi:hypothetical protein
LGKSFLILVKITPVTQRYQIYQSSIHRIVPDTAVKKSSDENSDILGG